jgi:hypothetical protein
MKKYHNKCKIAHNEKFYVKKPEPVRNPDLNDPKRSGYSSIRIHNTVFNGTSLDLLQIVNILFSVS